ncbi:MAG TPA: protein-glutamate O-methyltransferase CheR [Candidatus Eisenbacteria bacterium]
MDSNGVPASVETLSPTGYAYLQRLLLERTGIVLEPGKEYLVEARLHALMQGEGFRTVSALLGALQMDERQGSLHRRAVEAMLNGETSFFRDHYPFEALRTTILPELMAARAAVKCLTVWCAATASGQEAYSVAMLLLEHAPLLREWNVRILATDFSEATLQRAREGVYRQIEVNRGLPAPYLVKYFDRVGEEWRVKERVRGMVEFSQLNLIEPWPAFSRPDVILLRNVLLYFSSDARKTILQNVVRTLRPDGYLFLGGGETMLALDRTFESVRIGKAICYRIRGERQNGAPETENTAR